MKDVIIIGGGVSGMSAALYILRSNKTALILEKENIGGQISNSPKVENFPTIKSISGSDLADKMFEQISDMGVEFELEDVTKVEKQGDHFVVITNYNTYECRAVIIANGLAHKLIGLENEEDYIGHGISFCALCDGPMYKGKDVCLIGDANTAVQYAVALSNYCKTVNMFLLFDKFFADPILVERVYKKDNIKILKNMSLTKYIGDGKNLSGLEFVNTKTKEVSTIKTDNVFIAIGQQPDNERFSSLVDLENGFIITDELMRTKTPGVFACGDTRKKDIRQLITSCNDGAIAGTEAAKYLD